MYYDKSSIYNHLHFLLTFDFRQYYAYINVFILSQFPMYEFASVGLALVRFTLTKGSGVPKYDVLQQFMLIRLT